MNMKGIIQVTGRTLIAVGCLFAVAIGVWGLISLVVLVNLDFTKDDRVFEEDLEVIWSSNHSEFEVLDVQWEQRVYMFHVDMAGAEHFQSLWFEAQVGNHGDFPIAIQDVRIRLFDEYPDQRASGQQFSLYMDELQERSMPLGPGEVRWIPLGHWRFPDDLESDIDWSVVTIHITVTQ